MSANIDSSLGWPHWMVRYMLHDSADALEELIWSVGGSPPYGGISYEEAAAVFQLVENFRGKGMASPAHYAAVRKLIRGHRERERVMDLFECYDEIVSASDTYSRATANKGLAIAESIGAPAPIGLFKLYQAGVAGREGRNGEAATLTLEALDLFLSAVEDDPGLAQRVAAAAQNAIALTAMAGNRAQAAKLLDDLGEVLAPGAEGQLRRWLAAQR
jgi:hypothetical protein